MMLPGLKVVKGQGRYLPAFWQQMKLKNHQRESLTLLGDDVIEARLCLDSFQGTENTVCVTWDLSRAGRDPGSRTVFFVPRGGEGSQAAYHIISDSKEEGWTNLDPFPRDEDRLPQDRFLLS